MPNEVPQISNEERNSVIFEVNMQRVNKDFRAGAISPTFSLHVSGPTYIFLSYFYASTALVGLGLLLIEVSRSHSDKLKTNTHNRQTSVPPAEFEPAIPTSDRRQTHALDSAATRIGSSYYCSVLFGRDGSTHCAYAESVGQNLKVALLPLVIVDRPTHSPSYAKRG